MQTSVGVCSCHRPDRKCPQHDCQRIGCYRPFGHHGECDK